MSDDQAPFEVERSLARIGVRLMGPDIHLSNVTWEYKRAATALQQNEDSPAFEPMSDWWPKFVHRFIPSEEMWRHDASTILRSDRQAQEMFQEILAARDALAECLAEAMRSTKIAPLYPGLIDRMEALEAKMDAFRGVAQRRGDVRRRWFPWRGSVYAQEMTAWWGKPADDWRRRGPHTPWPD